VIVGPRNAASQLKPAKRAKLTKSWLPFGVFHEAPNVARHANIDVMFIIDKEGLQILLHVNAQRWLSCDDSTA